ncbi:hypothetical protein FG386_001600 [Cryptosporidium ryanae]|uniref:uncharacterized protein n=1 Tax=Cryptosporidium ryanae TaxID=515981 RepID=UPI00351A3E37|nr:hypothetical protein FG386_001600 [Cryptosporidium ryanae]
MRFSRLPNSNQSQSLIVEEQDLICDDNVRSKYGSRIATNDQPFSNQTDITLTLTTEKIKGEKEYEDYTETWEGDEQGLIWGKKEAKDKSWEEKWIEQRNIPDEFNSLQVEYTESNNNLYITESKNVKKNISNFELGDNTEVGSINEHRASLGQLSGIDYKKNKRWKEKWFRRGNKLFVRKYIEDLCENNVRVVNYRLEDSEFILEPLKKENSSETHWKLIQTNKYGKSNLDLKEWRENTVLDEDTCTTIYHEKGIKPELNNRPFSFICKRKKSLIEKTEIIYNSYRSGEFSEEANSFETTSKVQIEEEMRETRDYLEKQLGNEDKNSKYNEIWKEYIEIDNNGNKKGKKRGIKNEKTEWCEVWSEGVDGTNETDRWFVEEEKQWGEKFGYSKSSNERFSVVWEEFECKDYTKVKTVRKNWEKVGENNTWGETIIEKNFKNERIELVKENWYNNGSENFREEIHEDQRYSLQKYRNMNERIPEGIFRRGKKRGEGIFTGETWSEDWSENLCRTDEMNELLRTYHFTNKYWTDKNGDQWGEKRTQKLKVHEEDYGIDLEKENYLSHFGSKNMYFESGEAWSKSQHHEFFDYWEKDGLKQKGNKKGMDMRHDDKHVEWSEEWMKDEHGEFNKNYCWKMCDSNGPIEIWTEKELIEVSGRSNVFKCGTKYDTEDRNKVQQRWEEEYEDDGEGNTHAIKSGKGVENWYLDEFGSSKENGENWALKKGYNREGKWEEKWSEKPYYKEAWKKGENLNGDKWEEEWKEDFKNKWKWAQKSGENSIGDKWREEWREEIDEINNLSKKTAKKEGMKVHTGEEWSEEWGETYSGFGSEYMGHGDIAAEFVEKWTAKFASDGTGNFWGNSWGDHWKWGSKVKSWGEKWENDLIVEKW